MTGPVVFITGASGLVGANLVDDLLARGCSVVGFARDFGLQKLGLSQFGNPGYIQVVGDIGDGLLLQKVLKQYKPDHIVHLAAQALVTDAANNVGATFEANIRGTWSLMEAIRSCARPESVIVASSDKAYGVHEVLPYREDFELNAVQPYDLSKKITEEIALSYARAYDMPVTITRCGNVFGAYDLNAGRIVPGTILSCLNGRQVVLRSDGSSKRCYVYAKDVAAAYAAIMISPAEKRVGLAFNIGNDRPVPVLQMVAAVCDALGQGGPDILIENTSSREIPDQYLDCTRIKNVLGWEERHSLDEALRETVQWYQSFNNSAVFQSLLVG